MYVIYNILKRKTKTEEEQMVKHIIVWKLKDKLENKAGRMNEIKTALEGLVGKIDGLLEMHILTEGLPSSSGDLMMDSTFTDNEALKFYASHPLHVEIADGIVRPSVETRLAFDYEV